MNIRLITFMALLGGLFALTAPASAQNDCTFTVGPEDAPLYHAPLADPSQQQDMLSAGASYPVVSKSGPQYDALYLVTVDHAYGGWVDPRSGTFGGACDALPIDTTPLTSYPTICTLTASTRVPFFSDAALSNGQGALDPGEYVVTRRSGVALLVRLDHAMGGYVAAPAVSLSAACDNLLAEHPPLAAAGPNARVWSVPDVKSGQVLYTLPVGAQVIIIDGPVAGPIQLETENWGDWYRIQANGRAAGWVWSARLVLGAPPAPPTDASSASALANARLWSAPDVHAGAVIAFLDQGTRLHILMGPMSGPIRYDTGDLGDWYYVLPAGGPYAGWIWAGRLVFD